MINFLPGSVADIVSICEECLCEQVSEEVWRKTPQQILSSWNKSYLVHPKISYLLIFDCLEGHLIGLSLRTGLFEQDKGCLYISNINLMDFLLTWCLKLGEKIFTQRRMCWYISQEHIICKFFEVMHNLKSNPKNPNFSQQTNQLWFKFRTKCWEKKSTKTKYLTAQPGKADAGFFLARV